MPERRKRGPERVPWSPGSGPPGSEPHAPRIDKPDTKKLLERMRKIDRGQGRKFKQRSGE